MIGLSQVRLEEMERSGNDIVQVVLESNFLKVSEDVSFEQWTKTLVV